MQNATILARFMADHPKLTVLSGAGCSTASGIPEYRDDDGEWMHARPVQFADFVASPEVRQRYWARSYAGWGRISSARPNKAHEALAALERRGHVAQLITQNVDDLHRKAGSRNVIDLHGLLREVRCLSCGARLEREDVQQILADLNPGWSADVAGFAPDGDAQVVSSDVRQFRVADCGICGGLLKPDVVFFGENVPRERVALSRAAVASADALLVVGSSLMVYSGFRFVRQASEANKAVAIVNRGRTRADDLAALKVVDDCGDLLTDAVAELVG